MFTNAQADAMHAQVDANFEYGSWEWLLAHSAVTEQTIPPVDEVVDALAGVHAVVYKGDRVFAAYAMLHTDKELPARIAIGIKHYGHKVLRRGKNSISELYCNE